MNNFNQIIDNYLGSPAQYALQIDGEWGVGKTYFIRNTIIHKLNKANRCPVYLSVYGYNSLDTLKGDLYYQIISALSSNGKIMDSINELNKKFKKITNILGNNKLKSASLISDWILEAYNNSLLDNAKIQPIVIFIDDLERISKEIDLKDLLGFILNELLEKMKCKVIILSNSNEIPNTSEFKRIKEKVISRTIRFNYDISTIEDMILRESENNFISTNSKWISKILENYQLVTGNKGVNIRTLLSIIENFEFIESKLIENENVLERQEKISISKSIFLNVFVVTCEYKSGNISESDFEELSLLTDTRRFSYYPVKDREKTIQEKIIDKYHNKLQDFDDFIVYSNDINSYILRGYVEHFNYVENWKNLFYPKNKNINPLDQLNEFRRLDDEKLKAIQNEIITNVEHNKYEFSELLKVYGHLHQFEKMNLILIDNSYSEIIENKLKELYRIEKINNDYDVVEQLIFSGFSNITSERPEFINEMKKIGNQVVRDSVRELLIAIFDDERVKMNLMKQKVLPGTINIFEAILADDIIDNYIVTENNSADRLWQYINANYLHITNIKDFHASEVKDIQELLKRIELKQKNASLGRVDNFKITQLNNSLKELVENLD